MCGSPLTLLAPDTLNRYHSGMDIFHYFPGTVPVLVNVPHAGTHVPPAILDRFTSPAKQLRDTDWHVDKLYDFARGMGVHMLVATHSRFVIDLNRSPDDASLYPGKFTTGLCPTVLFDNAPIYQDGQAPDDAEIAQRMQDYWQPYHAKLQGVLQAMKQQHGRALLFDAHSIASQVPLLFDGTLADLNLGTADGASCDPALVGELVGICERSHYSTVLNGRFKGGYITRHYGQPAHGVEAVQMELAQSNYMNEAYPFDYDEQKAEALQQVLTPLIQALVRWVNR
jgi:N-formylglutamate deformylase